MVNAWRHYFVANEFAELQSEMRKVYPEVTFFWFVFLWIGLGWKNWCISDPYITNLSDVDNKMNLILELFIAGFLLICISTVQIMISHLNNSTYGTKINAFVDLCTLANVSLVMMYEHGYGFYLHGQAPWSSSDIPLEWLQKHIQDEGSDNKFSNSRALKHSKEAARKKAKGRESQSQ
jgi:meckelin